MTYYLWATRRRIGVAAMSLKELPELGEANDNDEIPLLSNEPGVPVVYASGVADIEIDGPNAVITFFRFRGEGPARVRIPVLEVVQPVANCGTGAVAAMLARKRKRVPVPH